MRRAFQIVGILTGILLISFFLQYSNFAIFPMHIGTVLDCSVKEGVTSIELAGISQKNNITTFTIVYDNTSFFCRNIYFKFLNVNPTDRICFGLQKNLLLTTHIYYTEQGGEGTYIQRFWAVDNKGADFKAFVNELEGNLLEYEQFNPVKINILDILNVQNLYFFMCVFLLCLFCSIVWFRMRCEEISVPELHDGKVFDEIKTQMVKNIRKIVTPYLLISGIFGAYILLRNASFIFDYIKSFLAFSLILLAIQTICVRLAFAIVRKAAASSFSDGGWCYFFTAFVLILQIIAVYLFIVSSQNTYFNVMNITMFEQGAGIIDNFSPAYISTSKIPDEPSMEHLLSVFDEIDMSNVYNYAHPTNSLSGYKELCDEEARDQMYRNAPTVRMSYNMLDYVPIYENDGERLRKEDFNRDGTTLLIPDHLRDNTGNILQNFYDGQSFDVCYIQSNQEHSDILDPSRRALNAMYMLTPVEKNIYYTNGEVLFDEDTAKVVEQKLNDYGFDQGTISLKKLSVDYDMIEDELKLAVVCDGLLWVMDAVCFFTMVIFGGTAFYRFRKRKIHR